MLAVCGLTQVCSNNINAALVALAMAVRAYGNRLPTCSLTHYQHPRPLPCPQVRKVNEGRGKHGRFLLGHQVVDSCCGGVFVLDVSTAQPFSGIRCVWVPGCG